jgi:hypothetical protein
LRFGRGDWKIVGVFDAGRTAFDNEIWGDLNQIATDFNRNEVMSSALVRAVDPISLEALKNSMADDQRLYLKQDRDRVLRRSTRRHDRGFLGMFVAVIMAVGSCGDEHDVRAAARRAQINFAHSGFLARQHTFLSFSSRCCSHCWEACWASCWYCR